MGTQSEEEKVWLVDVITLRLKKDPLATRYNQKPDIYLTNRYRDDWNLGSD